MKKSTLPDDSLALPPAIIRYQSLEQAGLARQLLIFECAALLPKNSQGRGVALVELADGRLFFFRSSIWAMKGSQEIGCLVDELSRLPMWIAALDGAANHVSYAIGAPLEFIDSNPFQIESWYIPEWKQHAVSWLAMNQPRVSVWQINGLLTEAAGEVASELSTKLVLFASKLDQDTYSSQEGYHCSWQSSHNYFTPCNEQLRRYRRQADTTFPLVIQQIIARPKDKSTASIIQAVDEGVPIVEHLANLFACPKKCVRHLRGLRFEDIGIQWTGRLKELLMILGSLDQNRLPKDGQEWKVFGETIALLSGLTKMPTTSLSARLLLGEFSKLNWRGNTESSVSLRERALAIERLSENIRQAIVATAWVDGKDCATGISLQRLVIEAACSLGLKRLEKLARKWVAREMQLDAKRFVRQADGFPVILDSPLEVGDMKVIQLKTPRELKSEGTRMHNCVESFAGSCASGSSYIFSVRDKSGASCVTVEYMLGHSRAGLPELGLIQQKGAGNSAPGTRYQAALDALHRYTASPMIRRKLLDLAVYQKACGQGGAGKAMKYIRSLEFIQFLKNETGDRLNFDLLVAEAESMRDGNFTDG